MQQVLFSQYIVVFEMFGVVLDCFSIAIIISIGSGCEVAS